MPSSSSLTGTQAAACGKSCAGHAGTPPATPPRLLPCRAPQAPGRQPAAIRGPHGLLEGQGRPGGCPGWAQDARCSSTNARTAPPPVRVSHANACTQRRCRPTARMHTGVRTHVHGAPARTHARASPRPHHPARSRIWRRSWRGSGRARMQPRPRPRLRSAPWSAWRWSCGRCRRRRGRPRRAGRQGRARRRCGRVCRAAAVCCVCGASTPVCGGMQA